MINYIEKDNKKISYYSINENIFLKNKIDIVNYKKLLKLLKNNNLNYFINKITLKKDNNELKNWIIQKTIFLNKKKKIKFIERIYCLLNNISSIKLCKICKSKSVSFDTIFTGYRTYCSQKCKMKDDEIKNKIKTTCKKRYNNDYYLGSKDYFIKTKETLFKKYNVNNVQQIKEVKEKTKNTKIKKYNGIGFQLKEIQEKAKNSILKKYGVKNIMLNTDVRNKIKEIANSEKTKNKRKNTVKNKYGVENISQLTSIKNKSYLTLIEKNENIKNKDKWFNKEFWINNFLQKDINIIDVNKASEFFNVVPLTIVRQLKRLGIYHFRPTTASRQETEIYNFIKDFYNKKIIRNSKKIITPYEIDIFIPEYNLGIEFDGSFWHSLSIFHYKNYELFKKEKYRQYNKVNLAHSKEIKLLCIRDFEWFDVVKNKICKSIILSNLNLNKKIYARKCEIVDLSNNRNFVDNFFNENHLQGNSLSYIYAFGLKYNDKIVAIMSFSKPRFNNNFEWELLRYCSKIYLNVIGGASKLFKYFLNKVKPKNVISYANRRFSNGNMYLKLGFEKTGISNPSYVYLKQLPNGNYKIINRIETQKFKLFKLLKNNNFDEKKTEIENMLNNNYRILFDAGNYIFKFT